jgi:hypothetical protein
MSDLKLPDSLASLQELQLKLEVQKSLVLQKAMKSDDPNKIVEAAKYFKDIEKRDESQVKSYIFDPWEFSRQFGYKDKPTSLSYNTLRRMGRTPIINSIITTRVEQVAAFSEPAYDEKGVGFIIRKKQGYLSKEEQKLSKQDEARIEWITDFIINCGTTGNSWHGDTFGTFLRKIVRDSLELDQMTFEVVRNRKGIPQEFIATDAATFRLADSFDSDEYRRSQRLEVNGYYPQYVQIFNNQPIADFYPWELCFGIRNHYTDVKLNGYGVSELENIINVITWMLYSDTYNGKFFSQGSAPKGIIKVSGAVNEARLAEFRQQWMSMVAGVQNAWRTPVMEAEKMEWIDLQRNNRDMEFTKWQEYLIKLSCASYKIDPAEIGFPMNGSSESKPMFEGNNEARLKYSKDKGLQPLLKLIENKLNKYVVNALDSNFEFKFVGLNPESESEIVDLDIKKAQNFMSLKEVRKKYNLPELPEDEDDIILNPYYFQMWSQKQAAKQQGNPDSNEAMAGEFPGQGFDEEKQQDVNYQDFMSSYGKEDKEDPFAKAFNDFLSKENNG